MDIGLIFQSFLILKIVVLLTIAGYAVFTFAIFSEINALNRIIHQASSPLLKKISLIQIILAISLFLFAIVIL